MVRTKLGLAAAAGLFTVPLMAGAAVAADVDCSDIGHPVVIEGVDQNNLDADGDGIGCESQPGQPAALTDQARPDQLADTGVSDMIHRHPVRAYGAAGLMVVGGAATVIIVRRRTRIEEN